jgi:hypothetical protein
MAGESDIEKAVCDHALERGYQVRKVKWLCRRGAPDRFFAHPFLDKPFMIEFKDTGETLRPDQKREVRALRNAGVTVYECDSVERGIRIIDEALIDIQ